MWKYLEKEKLVDLNMKQKTLESFIQASLNQSSHDFVG